MSIFVVLQSDAYAIEVFPGRQVDVPDRHLAEREEVSCPDREHADAHRDRKADRAFLDQLLEAVDTRTLGGQVENESDTCAHREESQGRELREQGQRHAESEYDTV